MSFESSQGIVFTFNSIVYTATSVSVTQGQGEFNVTSLNIPTGSGCFSRYRAGGLRATEIKVDWVGSTMPPNDAPYAISFAGSGSGSGTGLTGGKSMPKAIATGVTLTAQAGELLKGTASFKVSVD